MADHGLHRLLADSYAGVIFVSFDDSVEPLRDFMDAPMREFLDRVMDRPIEILGYTRQRIPGNWKLYFENLHDVYHAGLLHQQSTVFGQFRATQSGGITFDKRPAPQDHPRLPRQRPVRGLEGSLSSHRLDRGHAPAERSRRSSSSATNSATTRPPTSSPSFRAR